MSAEPTENIEQRLLDAALEAATIHGITKLSMGDVARRAGLSRQTLYRYFPSKDALIAASKNYISALDKAGKIGLVHHNKIARHKARCAALIAA